MKIKSLQLTIASLLLQAITLTALNAHAGGDLGGGGTLTGANSVHGAQATYVSNKEVFNAIQNASSLNEAEELWLESLTPEQNEMILRKVFRQYIAPSLVPEIQVAKPKKTAM